MLATKTHLEKQKLDYTEEDIQLKRKLTDEMDKIDREFQENFKKVKRPMESIGGVNETKCGIANRNFTVKKTTQFLI